MTTIPSPTPGGRKPWRKSEAPGHKPKHAPPPKPGTGETIANLGKKHKGKILAALGLAAAVGVGKGEYKDYKAIQNHRKSTAAAEAQEAATKQANETPRNNIIIPVTIQVQDGQIKITQPSGVKTDQCEQEHPFTITLGPGATQLMRKGRMKEARSVIITVEAHDQTHTYEADEDIVADGEERETTINAHLVSGKETHE